MEIICKTQTEAFVRSDSQGKEADLAMRFDDPKWVISRYPFLSFRVRRPVMTAKETVKIDLAFDLSNGQTWTASLTQPVEGKDRVNLPQAVPWESNKWHAVTINVYDLLKTKIKEADLQTLGVTLLHFRRADAGEKHTLDLQNLFVYSKWKPGDIVTMDAYDASGIDGITVEGANKLNAMQVAPASLGAGNGGWAQLQARDKAGNLSVPIRIPLP